MNSREIVRATLEFAGLARVARSFGNSDFVGCRAKDKRPETEWHEVGKGRWERVDEWGNTWGRVDPTSKGEVVRGALEDLGDTDLYEFPDLVSPECYGEAKRTREAHSDKWLIGSLPGFPFSIGRQLRRVEQYLLDILEDRERIHRLHDRIEGFLAAMIRNYAEVGADSVMFCEDWGSQSQLLIDPSVWHEEFFPRYQRLCGEAHAGGIKIFMHSCGQIESIVPWLMDAGIDLLQFDQPELHGLDVLAAHHVRGRITFWCPVDIQQTLQRRDERLIRAKAREMLDKLWKGRGGFVAGYYGDNASIGLDPKWQDYACNEFTRSGVRERYFAKT